MSYTTNEWIRFSIDRWSKKLHNRISDISVSKAKKDLAMLFLSLESYDDFMDAASYFRETYDVNNEELADILGHYEDIH